MIGAGQTVFVPNLPSSGGPSLPPPPLFEPSAPTLPITSEPLPFNDVVTEPIDWFVNTAKTQTATEVEIVAERNILRRIFSAMWKPVAEKATAAFTMSVADGPLPIGDMIGAGLLLWGVGEAIYYGAKVFDENTLYYEAPGQKPFTKFELPANQINYQVLPGKNNSSYLFPGIVEEALDLSSNEKDTEPRLAPGAQEGKRMNNDTILPSKINLPNKRRLAIRPATQEDAPIVGNIIRTAFSHWTQQGVPVSPAKQTDEQTWSHLSHGGIVLTFEDQPDAIIGSVTLHVAEISYDSASRQFTINVDNGFEIMKYPAVEGVEWPEDQSLRFLMFEKLVVDPAKSHHGVGQAVYDAIEDSACSQGFNGLVIETVEEATWLYRWYSRLGFNTVGAYQYPGSPLVTRLMIKEIKNK